MEFSILGQNKKLQGISPSDLTLVEAKTFGKITRNDLKGLVLQLLAPTHLMSMSSYEVPQI